MGKRQKPSQKKKRTERIYGTTTGIVDHLSFTINERGEMTFGNDMTNVYSEVSYERENRKKGEKVVYRIPQKNYDMSFDGHAALQKNYDFLCAVDTNTKVIDGTKVSATGVVTFKQTSLPGANSIEKYWKFDVPFCMEFTSVKCSNPENLGWAAALEQLHYAQLVTQRMRVGIVVDSDLGSVNDYNHGRKPVFDSLILPPYIKLLYASSDTANDSVVNKALSLADDVANQFLRGLATGKVPFNEKIGESPWYEGFRMIKPNLIET